jgi:hypothetical protein
MKNRSGKKRNMRVTKERKQVIEPEIDIQNTIVQVKRYLIRESVNIFYGHRVEDIATKFNVSYKNADKCIKEIASKDGLVSKPYKSAWSTTPGSLFEVYDQKYIGDYLESNIHDQFRQDVIIGATKYPKIMADALRGYQLSAIEKDQFLEVLTYYPEIALQFIDQYESINRKRLISRLAIDSKVGIAYLKTEASVTERSKVFQSIMRDQTYNIELTKLKLHKSEKEKLTQYAISSKNYELASAIVCNCTSVKIDPNLQYKLENYVLLRKLIGRDFK